jgi:aldehyde:ferredoxin oxidoreductase
MLGGYMGKILYVDLTKGGVKEETPDEKFYRDFIGGYGIGARIIYSRQKGKVEPLGTENILGFATGPLTGVPGTFGSRYVVMAKSPLTGTWGDANSGGDFGPYLKFAGCDAVFFTGISPKPVYLFIDEGKAELRDATHLWGRDTNETEDLLKSELGEEIRACCIGPAGEKLSLLSCIINDKGRAAGRSGLGAVMGSKRLKAVAVKGRERVPVSDKEKLVKARGKYLAGEMPKFANSLKQFGTPGATASSAFSGDSPVKNWGGVGTLDFPNAQAISDQSVLNLVEDKYGCWGCPISCGALMRAGKEYQYEAGVHRPEYETLCSFGTLCLNDNLESIIKANDICNRYGLDTISTGAAVAFAIECYENGLLTEKDTGGIVLSWGEHRAIVELTEKIAKREGFGEILADGVKRAAEKIGKGVEKYAFHAGGQELPMHDPRFAPGLALTYQSDATPGRHTQAVLGFLEMRRALPSEGLAFIKEAEMRRWKGLGQLDKYTYTGKGEIEAKLKNAHHLVNASGMCNFGSVVLPADALPTFLALVTGWELSLDELDRTGQRIAAIRQAFNAREGITAKDLKLKGRPIGNPPLEKGPLAKVKVDVDTLRDEFFKAMDWDIETGKPSKKKLEELGLEDVAKELWG